jgi:hypothetical protein
LFVLPDSKLFQKPEVDVDELIDAGEDPVNDVFAQVQVLVHALNENLEK